MVLLQVQHTQTHTSMHGQRQGQGLKLLLLKFSKQEQLYVVMFFNCSQGLSVLSYVSIFLAKSVEDVNWP